MHPPTPLLAAFLFVLSLSAPASADSDRAASDASLAGSWACQSVYGGPFTGRVCPTWPQLKLSGDGTYTWGSEQGTWEVKEGRLHLSGRTGTGHLDENMTMKFE